MDINLGTFGHETPYVLCSVLRPAIVSWGGLAPSTLSQVVLHLNLIAPWVLRKGEMCVTFWKDLSSYYAENRQKEIK